MHLIFSFPKTNNRNLLGRHGYCIENVVNMEPAPSSAACWKGFDNGKRRHYNQCRSAMCASLLISISNAKTESLHNSSPGQEAGLQYCGILASTGVTLRSFLDVCQVLFTPEHFDSQSVSSIPSSDDQWFLMEARSWTAWNLKRTFRSNTFFFPKPFSLWQHKWIVPV